MQDFGNYPQSLSFFAMRARVAMPGYRDARLLFDFSIRFSHTVEFFYFILGVRFLVSFFFYFEFRMFVLLALYTPFLYFGVFISEGQNCYYSWFSRLKRKLKRFQKLKICGIITSKKIGLKLDETSIQRRFSFAIIVTGKEFLKLFISRYPSGIYSRIILGEAFPT